VLLTGSNTLPFKACEALRTALALRFGWSDWESIEREDGVTAGLFFAGRRDTCFPSLTESERSVCSRLCFGV
jgi:hypothetical protein